MQHIKDNMSVILKKIKDLAKLANDTCWDDGSTGEWFVVEEYSKESRRLCDLRNKKNYEKNNK